METRDRTTWTFTAGNYEMVRPWVEAFAQIDQHFTLDYELEGFTLSFNREDLHSLEASALAESVRALSE